MFIYLVRHGLTQGNVDEVTCGMFDTPLTELGIKQAQATGLQLQGITFDKAFSSDRCRAYDTAKYILGSDQEIITTPLLRERDYAEFDGQPGTVMKEQRTKLNLTLGQFNEQHPTIEKNSQIIQRFNQFFEENLQDKPYEHVLIASHGSFLRVSLSDVIQTPRVELDHISPLHNASISIIEHRPGKPLRLISYNYHLHLLSLT